jgi:hypothetical protein
VSAKINTWLPMLRREIDSPNIKCRVDTEPNPFFVPYLYFQTVRRYGCNIYFQGGAVSQCDKGKYGDGVGVPLVGQDVAQGEKRNKRSKYRRHGIYTRVTTARPPSLGISSIEVA